MPKYEVTGPRRVRGHEPGSLFEHGFSPEQEARLIAAGHIKRRQSKPAAPPKPKVAKPAGSGKKSDNKEQ